MKLSYTGRLFISPAPGKALLFPLALLILILSVSVLIPIYYCFILSDIFYVSVAKCHEVPWMANLSCSEMAGQDRPSSAMPVAFNANQGPAL